MGFRHIMNMFQSYVVPCTIVCVVVALIALIAYYVIYKMLFHGQKKLNTGKIVSFFILLTYVGMVLYLTLVARGPMGYTEHNKVAFLESYKDAWVSFSYRSWYLLILNILMFVPIGFLLPIAWNKCQRFWITYLLGILFTVFIEVTQFVTGRGIFEGDDILNNALGCMIGYGFWKIADTGIARIRKIKKPEQAIRNVLLPQVPLLITSAVFGTMVIVYQSKELGNMSIQCIKTVDMENVLVDTEMTFSTEELKAYAYKAKTGSKEDTLLVAKQIMETDGVNPDSKKTKVYGETVVYEDSNNQYNCWVDYCGLTYHYQKFDYMESDGVEGLQASDISKLLQPYHIVIPETAEFQELGNGIYQYRLNMEPVGEEMVTGTLNCTIVEGNIVSSISNQLMTLKKYKEFSLISEKEAYQKVINGKFRCYEPDMLQSITIKDVELTYMKDSKNFYQPVYEFTTVVNGEGNSLIIPAVK